MRPNFCRVEPCAERSRCAAPAYIFIGVPGPIIGFCFIGSLYVNIHDLRSHRDAIFSHRVIIAMTFFIGLSSRTHLISPLCIATLSAELRAEHRQRGP